MNYLLKKRYKVIADYPNSPFTVGNILEQAEPLPHDVWREKENGTWTEHTILNAEKWDKFFVEIPWYHNRTLNEMPNYLKCLNESGGIEFVCKVDSYLYYKNDSSLLWAFEYYWKDEKDIKRMSLSSWIPSNEREYKAFNK